MDNDNRENLSGLETEEQWEETMREVPLWAKENRRILNEFEMLSHAIRGDKENENVGS